MKVFSTTDIRKFRDDKVLNDALLNASPFRRQKYDTIKNEIGELQVIANTFLLNKCLNEIGLNEKDMEYIVEKNGKLKFANAPDVHFNLSHSKNMSLAVVSDKPVGCDIQYVDKVDRKIFDAVLSDEEKKEIESMTDEKKICERFYELWAMKEAIIKKDGTGLRDNLADVHDDNVYIEKKYLENNGVAEKYILAIV